MKQRNNIVYKILKEIQDTISEYFIQNQENYTNKRADKEHQKIGKEPDVMNLGKNRKINNSKQN